MQISAVKSKGSAFAEANGTRGCGSSRAATPRDPRVAIFVEAGKQTLARLQGLALSETCTTADSLETAMAALLRAQAQQTTGTVRESESRIAQQLRLLKEQHEKQLEAMQRRKAAQKRSGRWARFLRVFKIVATVLSAAGSVCTGGAFGIVAGALLVASAVIADRMKGAVGQWLSLGLSLASGIAGTIGAALRVGTKLLSDGVLKALQYSRLAVGAGEAGGTVGQAHAAQDDLKAQADLSTLGAEHARVERELSTNKADTADALEERARVMAAVLKVLQSSSRVTESAG